MKIFHAYKPGTRILTKVISSFLVVTFLFTGTVMPASQNTKLAPGIRLADDEFRSKFAVANLARLIEDDNELDGLSSLAELINRLGAPGNPNILVLPGEIIIEIPDRGLAVRYYDPAFNPEVDNTITPFSDWSKIETRISTPRLVKQIIHRIKSLPESRSSALARRQAEYCADRRKKGYDFPYTAESLSALPTIKRVPITADPVESPTHLTSLVASFPEGDARNNVMKFIESLRQTKAFKSGKVILNTDQQGEYTLHITVLNAQNIDDMGRDAKSIIGENIMSVGPVRCSVKGSFINPFTGRVGVYVYDSGAELVSFRERASGREEKNPAMYSNFATVVRGLDAEEREDWVNAVREFENVDFGGITIGHLSLVNHTNDFLSNAELVEKFDFPATLAQSPRTKTREDDGVVYCVSDFTPEAPGQSLALTFQADVSKDGSWIGPADRQAIDKHIADMKERYGPDVVIAGYMGNGNAICNKGHIVFLNGELHHRVDEPIHGRPYSIFIAYNSGRHEILDVTIDENNRIISARGDITDEISWAISGERIVRHGQPVNWRDDDAFKGYQDPRHLFWFPYSIFDNRPEEAIKATGKKDVFREILWRDVEKKELARHGNFINLPLNRFRDFGYTDLDYIRQELIRAGYSEEEFHFTGSDLVIKLRPGVYQHHTIGVTAAGRVRSVAITSKERKKGVTLDELAEVNISDGITDSIMLDQGGDVLIMEDGKLMTESLDNRGVFISMIFLLQNSPEAMAGVNTGRNTRDEDVTDSRMVEINKYSQVIMDFLASREVYDVQSNRWHRISSVDELAAAGPFDVTIVMGSMDERVPAEGAEIVRQLLRVNPHMIVVTSGMGGADPSQTDSGKFTDAQGNVESEASHFAAIMRRLGVSVDIIEERSTNTGQNIKYSRDRLMAEGHAPKKILVLQIPHAQLRAGRSMILQYPADGQALSSMGVETVANYSPYIPVFSDMPEDLVLSRSEMLLGELACIRAYPGRGFMAPVDIPQDVLNAEAVLVLDSIKREYEGTHKKIVEDRKFRLTVAAVFGLYAGPSDDHVAEAVRAATAMARHPERMHEYKAAIFGALDQGGFTATWIQRFAPLALVINNMISGNNGDLFELKGDIRNLSERMPDLKYLTNAYPLLVRLGTLTEEETPPAPKFNFTGRINNSEPLRIIDYGGAPKEEGPPALSYLLSILQYLHPDIKFDATTVDIIFPQYRINADGEPVKSIYMFNEKGEAIIDSNKYGTPYKIRCLNAAMNDEFNLVSEKFVPSEVNDIAVAAQLLAGYSHEVWGPKIPTRFTAKGGPLLQENGMDQEYEVNEYQKRIITNLLGSLRVGGILFLAHAGTSSRRYGKENDDLFQVIQRVDDHYVVHDMAVPYMTEPMPHSPYEAIESMIEKEKLPLLHNMLPGNEYVANKVKELLLEAFYVAYRYQKNNNSVWHKVANAATVVERGGSLKEVFASILENIPPQYSTPIYNRLDIIMKSPAKPLVFRHRANDRETILSAIRDEADGVEFDLQLTRDGHVVLQHDPRFLVDGKAVTNVELTLEELRRLNPAILTLEDMLAIEGVHNLQLYVHLNDVYDVLDNYKLAVENNFGSIQEYNRMIIQQIIGLFKEKNVLKNAVFSSYDIGQLNMLTSYGVNVPLVYEINNDKNTIEESYDLAMRAKDVEGIQAIGLIGEEATPELIHSIQSRGWQVDYGGPPDVIRSLGPHTAPRLVVNDVPLTKAIFNKALITHASPSDILDHYTSFIEEPKRLEMSFIKRHEERVWHIAQMIGRRLDISGEEMSILRAAACGHDAGTDCRPSVYKNLIGQGVNFKEEADYANSGEYVKHVESTLGRQLDRDEKLAIEDDYRHGEVSVDFLKKFYTIPEEVATLIKYHKNYKGFLANMSNAENFSRLNLLLSILITADAFEKQNNAEALNMYEVGARELSTFADSINNLRSRGIDSRPISSLSELIREKNAELFALLYKARESDGLTADDMMFVDSKEATPRTGGRVKSDFEQYVDRDTPLLRELLGEGKPPVLLRVPNEAIKGYDPRNVTDFLQSLQAAPNVYIELLPDIGESEEDIYLRYGIERKPLPESLKERSRLNTITLLPANRGKSIDSPELSLKLRDLRAEDTVISPIGIGDDPAGLVRATILGLQIMDLARQFHNGNGSCMTDGRIDGDKVQSQILEQLKFIFNLDEIREIGIDSDDIIALATGTTNGIIRALNKLIKLLPIAAPIDAEELRLIYEHARSAIEAA